MTIDEAIANYQGISNYLQRYHAPDEEVQLQITNAKCAKWFTEVAERLRELKEAKQLLKSAAKIAKNLPCDDGNCSECVHNDNGHVCSEYEDFEWRFADEALKLIGETNDEP